MGLKEAVIRGLPPPNIIVSSGGGLHAYWIFTRDLSLDEWTHASQTLSHACHTYSFDIDNKCTVDAVRILRPPGTLNHKYDPKPTVEWVETGVADYEYESFAPATELPRRVDRVLSNPETSSLIPISAPPSDPHLIADRCANIRYFKETGCAQEGEEPLWKACMGVLAFCEKGEETAHVWSQKDSRYSPVEAASKLTERKKLSGASLCSQFENETDMASRSRCEACRFRGTLKSPISLGYEDGHGGAIADELLQPDVDPTRPMPRNYHIGSGVKVNSWGAQKEPVEITAYPLYYIDRMQGEASSRGGFIDVWEWHEKHGTWKVMVKAKSSTYAQDLRDQGVIICNTDPLMGYITACQKMEAEKRDRTMHYGCFGWKNDDSGFLWGDTLYREGHAPERVAIIDKSLDDRAGHLRPGGRYGKGDLATWKSNIRGLLQPGFEVQQLALLASVGAILIHFLAPSEGGAILHIVNPQSGTGKTTALKIAASVWGDIEGLSSTVDDTATSKSIKWGYLRHLPLIFDELVERDPTATEKLIRTFTVGTDKSRALIDGSGLQENNREWSTILISAGNRSIIDTVNIKAKSAMAERVLEFIKEFPKDISTAQQQNGQKYANAVAQNCGWAGEVILKSLFEGGLIGQLEDYLDDAVEEIKQGRGWAQKTQRRYWLRALASMKVAGAVLNGLQLIDFDYDRAITWACDELDKRDMSDVEERMSPIEALSSYLDNNLSVTLVMAGEWHRGTPRGAYPNTMVEGYPKPQREVYIRREIDTNSILIEKVHFKAWLTEHEQHARAVIDALSLAWIIVDKDAKATLSGGTELQSGQKGCYRVDGNRLTPP